MRHRWFERQEQARTEQLIRDFQEHENLWNEEELHRLVKESPSEWVIHLYHNLRTMGWPEKTARDLVDFTQRRMLQGDFDDSR